MVITKYSVLPKDRLDESLELAVVQCWKVARFQLCFSGCVLCVIGIIPCKIQPEVNSDRSKQIAVATQSIRSGHLKKTEFL